MHSTDYTVARCPSICPSFTYQHCVKTVKQHGNIPTETPLTGTLDAVVYGTRGQSNLTKSALRGARSPVRVTPGGRNLYH